MAELTTIARPYAKAAFDVAINDGALKDWSDGLATLDAIARHEKIASALARPSLTGEERARMLIDLCGEQVSQQLRNFVKILAQNKRLGLLPVIIEQFEEMKAEQEKTLDVKVVAAKPLDADTQDKLAASLSRRLQREISIQTEIDEGLIGGVVVYAGDLVIDGSVKGKIGKLTEAMKS